MSTATALICPNCDIDMESDARSITQVHNIEHTCPSCGWSESR